MGKPRIKATPDSTTKVLMILGILGILAMLVLPYIYLDDLPQMIPVHFDSKGVADNHMEKQLLWVFPIVEIIIFLGLALLARYPHVFNYTQEITSQNAERMYTKAIKVIWILNTSIALIFAVILYLVIQSALG